MEIFLDTARIEEIREAAKLGIISGVTTNPSLMMRAWDAVKHNNGFRKERIESRAKIRSIPNPL